MTTIGEANGKSSTFTINSYPDRLCGRPVVLSRLYVVLYSSNVLLLTAPEKGENSTITGHFGAVLGENSSRIKSHDCRHVIAFERLRFENVFRSPSTARPAFSNSSGLKSAF